MTGFFNASTYLIDRQIARGFADCTAVAGPGGTLTYAQLRQRVVQAAAGWRAAGLRPEERVMLHAADGPALLVALLSAMRCGAVPVPVSTMGTAHDLALALRDSRARFLVTGPDYAGTAQQALGDAGAVPDLSAVIVLDDAPVQPPDQIARLRWEHLLSAGATGSGTEAPPDQTTEDSPALWLYTSGSTGTPKAAMHRHASIREVAESYGHRVLGLRPGDRCFSVAKLFFAYGLGNSCFLPLAAGATAILDSARPTPGSIWRRLAEDAPTVFFGVPTAYAALLRADDLPQDAFSTVRAAVSAGEPLPPELGRRFQERFGVELLNALGSTEALHIFLSNRPGQVRPGTIGTPVPGYDLRIVAEDGSEAGAGEPGVLKVRAPSAALGYWSRTQASRAVFQGEWIDTGDLLVRSEDGYYTCLGRANDMIKSGGIWVSPAEVEDRLLQHPAIAQAAVVAAPDRDGLDRPIACVVAEPGHGIDSEAVIGFCRAQLPSFKCPRHVVEFPALPTTGSGKVDRRLARQQALACLDADADADANTDTAADLTIVPVLAPVPMPEAEPQLVAGS